MNRLSSISFGLNACLVAFLVLVPVFSIAISAEPNPESIRSVDFKTEIRPILSNRCFACHGPDEGHVESGLRLDQFESATSPADSGKIAVVPNKVSESEMVRRILSQDEEERMPPPHFGARLTERETTLLQAWVENGATYSKHWSFDEIRAPDLKELRATGSFSHWQHSPIDLLILKKLEEKGWQPSPQARPETLLRRLSLDLTGLPPSLDDQQAFASNFSDQLYEQRVDELLASPAFGEHWGRKWLDLARYADSAGYADDPARTIWAYRDWVISAINQGMPFDQFTIEQLAGDLLPNPTEDQLVATAFHRNTLTNNEGGTNDEEFRNVAVVDRVNTTMAVWMGVTMACAQCHSHKFDPISQKEYFQVFAILNQTQDADRTDESPTLPWFTPEQRRTLSDTKAQLELIEKQINAPDPSLQPEQDSWSASLKPAIEWTSSKPDHASAKSGSAVAIEDTGAIQVVSSTPTDVFTLDLPIASFDDVSRISGLQIKTIPDASLPGGGAAIGNGNFVLTDVSASLVDNSPGVQGRFVRIDLAGKDKILSLAEVRVIAEGMNVAVAGTASQSSDDFDGPAGLAIDGKTTGVFSEKSTTHSKISDSPWWELDLGKVTQVESIEVWNRTDAGVLDRLAGAKVQLLAEDRKVIWETTIGQALASQTYDLKRTISIPWLVATSNYAQDGFPSSHAIDGNAKTGWAVGGAIPLPHQLNLAVNVAQFQKRFANSDTKTNAMKLRVILKFESDFPNSVLARFAINLTQDQRTESMLSLPNDILALTQRDPASLIEEERRTLHLYYASNIAPSRKALREQRTSLKGVLANTKPTTTVPILRELPADRRRVTHVQLRGNYKVLGDEVKADLPTAFHPRRPNGTNSQSGSTSTSEAGQSPVDRLQFAQWLTQPDNPLTARVVANRFWETFFGVGIVRTSEEFGSQGDLPTHPELLDFLATDLQRDGWDTKKFIRKLVMSAAYRQQSFVSPTRYEEDPDNVYLSRGPRFRVTAEQVRDMALESAGLLSHTLFGPPTQPPQPSLGLSAAFGSRTDWETSKGADRYRRGLYTLWRRSNPYPSMATFDAPNREVCVLKRDRTNTPLQALVTMNDPAFVEAAQGLARRVVLHELPSGTLDQRIERAFQHTLSRKPSVRESQAVAKLYYQTVEDLASQEDRAMKLATDPIGPLPDGADKFELAAWTTLCNVILNLDEFLMTP
jgi:hypothetical protein